MGDALQGRTIYPKYIQENKGLRILDIDGQQHLYVGDAVSAHQAGAETPESPGCSRKPRI